MTRSLAAQAALDDAHFALLQTDLDGTILDHLFHFMGLFVHHVLEDVKVANALVGNQGGFGDEEGGRRIADPETDAHEHAVGERSRVLLRIREDHTGGQRSRAAINMVSRVVDEPLKE